MKKALLKVVRRGPFYLILSQSITSFLQILELKKYLFENPGTLYKFFWGVQL